MQIQIEGLYLLYLNQNTYSILDICLQVDPTNNDVMNDVLSKEKSMDSLNIHIEIRDKEEGVILCQQALCHRGDGRSKNLEGLYSTLLGSGSQLQKTRHNF